MPLKKSLSIVCIILLIYGGVFLYLREETAPLPRQLVIEHSFGQEYFLHQHGKKYCYGSQGHCGYVENITENGFDVVWEESQKTSFSKKSATTYAQIGSQRKPFFMPFRKNISLQLNNKIIFLKQDKKGNCTDENGTYIGRVVSESQTKLPKKTNAEVDTISQETLYFETPDKQKHLFVLNTQNIYEPLIISAPKNFKILVAISSYKRPIFLSGQILRFLNQTYQNFDISVSIKGFEKEENDLTFLQEWEPLIQKNKMRLTFDKNKGQLSNLLDTMRGVDLSKYDYICKIDDDDWYAPTYLETLNRHLNADTDIAVSVTPNFYHLNNASISAFLRSGSFPWPGATICFQKSITHKLFEVEKLSVSDIQKQLPIDTLVKKPYTLTGEDILIGELAQKTGKVQTRTSAIPLFVHGNQYPSTTKPF